MAQSVTEGPTAAAFCEHHVDSTRVEVWLLGPAWHAMVNSTAVFVMWSTNTITAQQTLLMGVQICADDQAAAPGQECLPKQRTWQPASLLSVSVARHMSASSHLPAAAAPADLELLQGACHALHCLVKGGCAGDNLGQQRVIVAAHNISCRTKQHQHTSHNNL